jgi:hypothetical protein
LGPSGLWSRPCSTTMWCTSPSAPPSPPSGTRVQLPLGRSFCREALGKIFRFAMWSDPWAGQPARLAGIEPLRWGIRPGERWSRLRGSPITDLRPQMGGKTPVGSRPAAPRRAGHGAAWLRWCSGLGGGGWCWAVWEAVRHR